MSFKKSLEDATSHFLRSQLTDCLSKLKDMKEISATKESVVLQCVVMNNCELCVRQLGDFPRDAEFKSYEDILHCLKGLPLSRNRSIVESIIYYNRAVCLLHESSSIQLETKASAVVLSIEKKLNEVLQCLDESSVPVLLLRCALSLSQQLAGTVVSDWKIPSDCGKRSKESWHVAMAMPAGCRVLSPMENEHDVREPPLYEKLSLEAVQALLRCHQACQTGAWDQALKTVKHNKKHWKGWMKDEVCYIKNFCLFQLSSFEEAKQNLQTFLLGSSLSPSLKVKGHQLLACCYARQEKFQLAISEFKKALACVTGESPLLSLHNLSMIFQKLGRTDAEMEILSHLVDVSSEDSSSLEEPRLVFSPVRDVHGGNADLQVKAMYACAHRSLQLERFNEAAGMYLDLVGLLEDSSFSRSDHSTLLPVDTPAIPQIYLEAGLALFNTGNFDEAESVCNVMISRLGRSSVGQRQKAPQDLGESQTGTGAEEDVDEDRRMKKQKAMEVPRVESLCQPSNSRHVDASCFDAQLHLASFHFMKSQCLMKMKKPSLSLESLNQALLVLHEYSFEGREGEEATTPSPPSPKGGWFRPGQQHHSHTHQLEEDVRLLKGRAYNNKSLILIGQGKLHEALPVLLSSLECCPEDPDMQKNYYLLLFKLGRKKQAYQEWRKFQNSSH